MLSQVQMSSTSKMNSITQNKSAMPESVKFNGPGEVPVSGSQNRFAANSNTPLPKPGFDS